MGIDQRIDQPGPSSDPDWQVVGQIVAAHGLKGWVRVRCLSDFPERLLQPGPRWLRSPSGTTGSRRPLDRSSSSRSKRSQAADPIPFELLQGQFYPPKKLYLVQFEGLPDRTAAEAWVGAEVLISGTDRPDLEEDEYYLPDLIGLPVFHQPTGQQLGILTTVIPAGNDLLEVTTEQQETILIPFVKQIVPVVDLTQGRIEVVPPVGLLETFIDGFDLDRSDLDRSDLDRADVG